MKQSMIRNFLTLGLLFLFVMALSGTVFADQPVSRSTQEDIDPLQSGINLLLSSFVEKAHKVEDVDIEADTSLALMKLDGQVGITRQYLPLQNGVWLNRLRFNKTFTSGMTLWGNMQNLDNSSRHLDLDLQEGTDWMVNFYYDRLTHWVNPKPRRLNQEAAPGFIFGIAPPPFPTWPNPQIRFPNTDSGLTDDIIGAAVPFQPAGFFANRPADFLAQGAWNALRFASDFHKSRDEFFAQGRGRLTENIRFFGNAGLKKDFGTREGNLITIPPPPPGPAPAPHGGFGQRNTHIHLLHIPIDWALWEYRAGMDYVSEKVGVKAYYKQDSFENNSGYYFRNPAYRAEAINIAGRIPADYDDLNRYSNSDGSKARVFFNAPVLDTVTVSGGWQNSRAKGQLRGRTYDANTWDFSATVGPYYDFSAIFNYTNYEAKYNFIQRAYTGIVDAATGTPDGSLYSLANTLRHKDRNWGATINWTGSKEFTASFSFQDHSIDRSRLYWTGILGDGSQSGFYYVGYMGGIFGNLNVLAPLGFNPAVYPQGGAAGGAPPVFLPITTNEENRTWTFRADWRPDQKYYFTGRFRKIDGDTPFQRTVATDGTDWNLVGTFTFNPNISLILNYDNKDRNNNDSHFKWSETNYGATVNARFMDRFTFAGSYNRQDASSTYDLLFIFVPGLPPWYGEQGYGTGGSTPFGPGINWNTAPFGISTNGIVLDPNGRLLHYKINNDNWMAKLGYQASNTLSVWGKYGVNQSRWGDFAITQNPDPNYAQTNILNSGILNGNRLGVNFRQTTYGIGCNLQFKNAEKRIGFAWQRVLLKDLDGEREMVFSKVNPPGPPTATPPTAVESIRQSYSGKADLFTATYTQKF